MKTRDQNTTNVDATPDRASLPSLFCSVARNLAIYHAAHPRVTSAATEFVALVRQHCASRSTLTLSMRGEELLLDGENAKVDARTAGWYTKRFRECGLRGLEFAATCTTDDVVALASAVNKFRARTGATFVGEWKHPGERVTPLPLVFDGGHDESGGGDGSGAGGGGGTGARDGRTEPRGSCSPVRRILDRVAGTAAGRHCLDSIERHTQTEPGEEAVEFDLLAAVEQLMPADIAHDPRQIEDAVMQIMTRIETSLSEIVRKNARVKGAELLRIALGVARKYFNTEAPAQTQQAQLPSGRPEDAAIVADLGLLRQEVAALPQAAALRLPEATELANGHGPLTHGLAGIVLHTLAGAEPTQVAAEVMERIRLMLPACGESLTRLLGSYLGPASPTSAPSRLRILDALLAAGHRDMLRKSGLVDAAFVARSFPEGLCIAARVLGGDDDGVAMLREGLASIGSTLSLGGAAAAVRAGALKDAAVVSALMKAGGPEASSLLVAAASTQASAERQMLLACARETQLPAAELAVLRSFDGVERLPRDYLPHLMVAVATGDFGGLCAANGALLRRRVLQGTGRLSQTEMIEAVSNLEFAPGPETEVILRRLATMGRFTKFGARARALRRCARTVLAKVTSGAAP